MIYDGPNSSSPVLAGPFSGVSTPPQITSNGCVTLVFVSDLNVVDDPLNTVKQMIEFSINFAEKFYATLCDQDRTPITKQMISHIESRAQDIARLKQLNISDTEK